MKEGEDTKEGHALYQKAIYYLEDKKKIHISGTNFYNGYILEVRGDFIIFKDDKLGAIPVFFSEIKSLEPCIDREARE